MSSPAFLPALASSLFIIWIGVAGMPVGQAEAAGLSQAEEGKRLYKQMMELYVPFPTLVTVAKVAQPSMTRKERWARAYAMQDERNRLTPGTCAAKLPDQARVVATSKKLPPLIRAGAHFMLEDFEVCEDIAVEVTKSPSASALEKAMAWGIAANVSLERAELDEARTRFEKAAAAINVAEYFNTWPDSQQGLIRVAQLKGDRARHLALLRGLQKQSTLSLGPTSGTTMGYQNRTANELYLQGLFAEAEKEYRDLLKALEERPDKDVMQVQVLRDNLAKAIAAQGRKQEAENLSVHLVKEPLDTTQETGASLDRRSQMGAHFFEQRRFAEATEQFGIVYEAIRQRKGEEHKDTLTAQNNLAAALQAQGKNEEAVELLLRVIAIREKHMPADDLVLMENRNNLGNALSGMGAHEEAVIQHRRVAEVRRRELGPKNTKTLDALVNLAADLKSLKQYDEALKLAREVVAGRESVHGAEDARTLRSRSALVSILISAGMNQEAEAECRAALLVSEKKFGLQSISTLTAYYDLASVYFGEGRMEESRKWCLKALEGYRKTVGPHNPQTIECEELLSKLALYPGSGGRLGADPTLASRSVLAKNLNTFGPTHPQTLLARTTLAHQLQIAGKYADAATEYEITLSGYKSQALMQTEDAIDARNGQAELMRHMGRLDESEALFRPLLDDCVSNLPEDHAYRAACLVNFALLLKAQGKYEEALTLQKEVLLRHADQLDQNHPRVIKAYAQIADTFYRLGRVDEWRVYMQKAYDLSKSNLGEQHVQTQTFKTLLADPKALDPYLQPKSQSSTPAPAPTSAGSAPAYLVSPPDAPTGMPGPRLKENAFEDLKKSWDGL